MAELVPNQPNASKLIESLRYIGYDSYSALADLVDNSLDAGAMNVAIVVRQIRGEIEILVADDGVGMDYETLDDAMRLGSLSSRSRASDLGYYGMGLVTACLSLCRVTDVITRKAGGALLMSSTDIDKMIERNEFVKSIGHADQDASLLFEELVGDGSGTVVRLRKCDRISNHNTSNFSSILRKRLSQIHRMFLSAGRTISVNGSELQAIDPLMLDNPGTDVYSDEEFPVSFKREDGSEVNETVRLRIVVLPDFGLEGNESRGINYRNQGFYVLRNNREIASGETLGVFVKHNYLNRVRAELHIPGTLDDAMGVNFAKQNLSPNQAVLDKLKTVARGQIYSLKNRISRAQSRSSAALISHEEAARLITQKSSLLLKPRSEPRTVTQSSQTGSRSSLPDSKCEFRASSMSNAGPIFGCEQQGSKIIVSWNTDHPFYQRFILDNQDNPSMLAAVDFLVYCLANAELMYTAEDTESLLTSIRSAISANMRVLLS